MVKAFSQTLQSLIQGHSLDGETAAHMIETVIRGELDEAQTAAFLVALEAKGVQPGELVQFAATQLTYTERVHVTGVTFDVVGTGGDGYHTVNISTMAALAVAGTGRTVVKHGNRAASSKCGTADVLEELGVNIELDAAGVEQVVAQAGMGFCFAGRFHHSMAAVLPVRRSLGVRTVFNYMGPLLNPARPTNAAVGVAKRDIGATVSDALEKCGTTALVLHGHEGLDELSICGPTSVWTAEGGVAHEHVVVPEDMGVPRVALTALRGGDRVFNAEVVRSVVRDGREGPVMDAVVVNAAAALATERKPGSDPVEALRGAIPEIQESIMGGAAWKSLRAMVEASQAARSRMF
ncbi:anthranilate phosphoribosyltransferase [Kineosporia babensis]|uniref:Anthranilate phosphoribosyltransferase n=1 Tax=Kineosporia babensis TaxID=499548 RepID=A0A9X1NNR7_9ACTN|nr:anthranilate phosphoribosyltransferase [Kineosporia babensis]